LQVKLLEFERQIQNWQEWQILRMIHRLCGTFFDSYFVCCDISEFKQSLTDRENSIRVRTSQHSIAWRQ
jgi:hypothetical protein